MKTKLFIIALVAISLVGCKTEEPTIFKLDPTAKVYIKPATSQLHAPERVKANSEHLTPLEIVKRATTMRFSNLYLAADGSDCAAGFAGKDTVSTVPAFLRYGTDIINPDGFGKPYLVPDFIYAYDCVIEIFHSNTDIDTIAYIPNSVFRTAETEIKAALEAKDTTAVYGLFQNAFKFIPITGAEYRELKKTNQQ